MDWFNFVKIKNFSLSKDIIKEAKRQIEVWEMMFKYILWIENSYRICGEFLQVNEKSILKMDKNSWIGAPECDYSDDYEYSQKSAQHHYSR